jgi:hypothetical protein
LLQACFLLPCLLQPSVRHARGPRPPPPTLEVVSPPRPASTAVLRHRDPSRRFQMMLQRAGLVPSHPPVAHTSFTVLPEVVQCRARPHSHQLFFLCASDRNPLCVGGPADDTLAGADSSHIVRGSRRLIERARCNVMWPPHRLQPGAPTNARSRVSLSNSWRVALIPLRPCARAVRVPQLAVVRCKSQVSHQLTRHTEYSMRMSREFFIRSSPV